MTGLPWLALAIGVCMNALANILVKAGVRDGSRPLLERITQDPWYILGMTSFGIALVFYSYALTKIPLTNAYPIMTGLGMAIVATASWFWFGEDFNVAKFAGMGLIFAGIVLLIQ